MRVSPATVRAGAAGALTATFLLSAFLFLPALAASSASNPTLTDLRVKLASPPRGVDDAYRVFDLKKQSEDSSKEQLVQRQYKRMALQIHPDKAARLGVAETEARRLFQNLELARDLVLKHQSSTNAVSDEDLFDMMPVRDARLGAVSGRAVFSAV